MYNKRPCCSRGPFLATNETPHSLCSDSIFYENAMLFLISAIASAGLRPLGHVRLQFKMVWHRYKLMLLFRASLRWAVFSSRESAIQR